MIRTVIFGAGQGGRMIDRLLRPQYNVLAYADNDSLKWGTLLSGIPVISPKQALRLAPDCIWVAVWNRDSSGQICTQLRSAGYNGELRTARSLSGCFDLRLAELRLLAEEIINREVPGAAAELGVFQGDFSVEINRRFPDRHLHLFDTFQGFSPEDIQVERLHGYSRAEAGDFGETDPDMILSRLPNPQLAVVHKGYFPETAPEDKDLSFAFVSLDADLFAPTYAGLDYFYPRLNSGGVVMVHDYNSSQFSGSGEAVRRYCRENRLYPVPLCDLHGSAVLVKP